MFSQLFNISFVKTHDGSIEKQKVVPFQSFPNGVQIPNKLQKLEDDMWGLCWQGISIKYSEWYPDIAEKHISWMKTIGGERMQLGKEGERIDTMFFSTSNFTKKLREYGGKYATIQTNQGKIQGIAFPKNKIKPSITQFLKGIEGRDGGSYGFLDSGWQLKRFGDHIIVFPNQYDNLNEPIHVKVTSVDISDQEVSFVSQKTVVIAPGIKTLYEIYDDILGEVPAFLQKGLNVLLFNYRGYGQSEGLPSEKAIDHDLEMIMQYLNEQKEVEDHDLILKGVCLGGGPISRVALKHPKATIMLDQTFADIDTFVDIVVKKNLDTLISIQGEKKQLVAKVIATIGRQIVPPYKNNENISKMKNNLCLMINHNDELIPQLGNSGSDSDENAKNIAALPDNEGQKIAIISLDGIGHAEGWYKNRHGEIAKKNPGRFQMHDFLNSLGFGHDLNMPLEKEAC